MVTTSVSNTPLGVGFDSKNRPTSFVQLSSVEVDNIEVSSLSATELTVDLISSNLPTLVIDAVVSASQFVGIGASEGVSSLVNLLDVTPGLNLSLLNGQMLTVSNSLIQIQTVESATSGLYQPSDTVLQLISENNLANPVQSNSILYFNSSNQGDITSLSPFGRSLIAETNSSNARDRLQLSALATKDSIQFDELSNYPGDPASDSVAIITTAGALSLVPSSTFVANAASSHSELLDRELLDAHTQYMDISGIRAFTQNVSCLVLAPTSMYHLTTKSYVDSEISTNLALKQDYATTLEAIVTANPGFAASELVYWTNTTTAAKSNVQSFGLSILDTEDAAEVRNLLELSGLATSDSLSLEDLANFPDPTGQPASSFIIYNGAGSFTYTAVSSIRHDQLVYSNTADLHPNYLLSNGTRALQMGTNLSSTTSPQNANEYTNRGYVDGVSSTLNSDILSVSSALIPDEEGHLETIGGLSPANSGDMLIFDGSKWVILERGGDGEVLQVSGGSVVWGAVPSLP